MSLWKSFFGISQQEAWSQLAQQVGGVFREGGWMSPSAVYASVGGYDLLLDTYTVSTGKSSQTYTRLRAPFVNGNGLRLKIHRAHFFTPVAKAFGQQDIEVGDPAFDKDFVIGGNDEARIRQALHDPALRALLMAQPEVQLEVADSEGVFGDKYGRNVDLLRFLEHGVIRDVDRLRGLFALFGALLHALQSQGGDWLAVPPAAMPATFAGVLDDVLGAFAGRTERVGETFEARFADPLGLAGDAQVTLAIPALPGLVTTLAFDAGLPASSLTLHAEKRGLLTRGSVTTGDARVDDALAIEGDAALATQVVQPLARLAPHAPTVTASAERLTVSIEKLDAHDAPVALGAVLDLWQGLCRARAGAA